MFNGSTVDHGTYGHDFVTYVGFTGDMDIFSGKIWWFNMV
jgi:hypothetical protein